MELLTEGLKLEFKEKPPLSYEEDNNASARQNMTDLVKTVRKWENEGACIEVKYRPPFLNPMSISVELDDLNNVKKKRPCIDLSRLLLS